jgi:protease-4
MSHWSAAIAIAAGMSWAGCGKGEATSGAAKSEAAPADDEGESGANMFGPLAKMLSEGLDKPGPYDEPRHSETYAEGTDHYAVLELDDSIAEVETMSLLDPQMSKPLRDVTQRLHALADDAHVKGVIIRATGLALDMATAEELREAVRGVAAKGKTVACHTEGISNAGYHVFTGCDRIGVAPLGEIVVTGAAATPVHIKGLLDQFDVKADFLHVGAYKGAAEPLTREAPSEQMMETLTAIVERSYATQRDGIVQGRGLTEAEATAAIDEALFIDEAAVKAKLADTVATWEAFLAETTGETPWTLVEDERNDNPLAQMMELQRFIGLLPPKRPVGPHVALVYAVGNVVDGKGGGAVGAREQIASRTLSATMRALGRDDDVKAIVMRVNSPGGSALASEQIHAAVAEVVAKKPVVVSMGPVAASGGYYISAGATKIFADPNTLTGSIGVVGGKLVIGGALERFGVKTYEVHKGERALLWSAMDPWTDSERAAIQSMMDQTYERFLLHVASGRKMERDAVHELAQGRVWTGADAKDHGLVDELGGLDAALAAAAKLGGVEVDAEVERYPGAPTLRDLLGSIGQVSTGIGLQAVLPRLAEVAGPVHAREVARILRLLGDLRDTRIWAVSWVQPAR